LKIHYLYLYLAVTKIPGLGVGKQNRLPGQEPITERTKEVKKCCGVSESANFYTTKWRSVPVNGLDAGKSAAFSKVWRSSG
jgi:hypothetical protein